MLRGTKLNRVFLSTDQVLPFIKFITNRMCLISAIKPATVITVVGGVVAFISLYVRQREWTKMRKYQQQGGVGLTLSKVKLTNAFRDKAAGCYCIHNKFRGR